MKKVEFNIKEPACKKRDEKTFVFIKHSAVGPTEVDNIEIKRIDAINNFDATRECILDDDYIDSYGVN